MHVRIHKIYRCLGLGAPGDAAEARKAFILNVLLVAVITLLLVAIGAHLLRLLNLSADHDSYVHNTLPLFGLIIIFAFFSGLLTLSVRGKSFIAAPALVVLLLTLGGYMSLRWGVDVTASILFFILAVIMAGMLVNTRFGIGTLCAVLLFMFVVGYWQERGVLRPDQYWRLEEWSQTDTVITGVILAVIAVVCILSNWQSEHALTRAIASEEALKNERDRLEETVEDRTRELRKSQMERVATLYRFAEFGRLSSGMFHSIGNLLTALTVNMDSLRDSQTWEVTEARSHLHRALAVNEKMRGFVEAVRHQLAGTREKVVFSPDEEVSSVLQVIGSHALALGVSVEAEIEPGLSLKGDPAMFNQIVTNLAVNAVDAYRSVPVSPDRPRVVRIGMRKVENEIELAVHDFGCGIPQSLHGKIFEPFFTTKQHSDGIGIGLALVKRMVESDYGGTIKVESEEGNHTIFIVRFPTSKELLLQGVV